MSKFLKIIHVIADNTHIAELINVIKIMISKQKQQAAAFMKANMYVIAFQFRIILTATRFSSVHEISTCLARKIVIRCFNMILKNHIQSITQLVKKINKKKSQNMLDKMLTIRKLLSRDIVIIINTEKTKKQLKQNNN